MSVAIRKITADELHSFAQFAACPDRGFAPSSPLEFEKWLGELWREGQSSPACCFVAERDGNEIAAAVYWLRGSSAHIEHLRFPVDDPSILERLLADSLELMRLRGTISVWAEVSVPLLGKPHLSVVKRALERTGFGVGRERLTFIWVPDARLIETPCRLSFRSLKELGQPAFIDALAEMSADSLDAEIAASRRKKGPHVYAVEEFADQAMTRHELSWWQIAYDADGKSAGIVLTGIVGRQPAVLLLAVKPSHRGQHFARDLLAQVIRVLRPVWSSDPAGSLKASIRGDVDAVNFPMVQAFRDVGFRSVRSCRQFERHPL
jgi:GNAT superfamily N-acetyltransferase